MNFYKLCVNKFMIKIFGIYGEIFLKDEEKGS